MCCSRVIDRLKGEPVPEDEAYNDAKKRAEATKPKPGDFPIEGHHYAIKLYGTKKAFTCVDGTSLRLRDYNGSNVQRFRCTYYDEQMGFNCEGSDSGKGRYIGYDSNGTFICQASEQRDWEYIDALADPMGGYVLWMKKDDQFEGVSVVNQDELKVTPTMPTRFSFEKLD